MALIPYSQAMGVYTKWNTIYTIKFLP
jgi:hypothetical protein